MLEFFHISPSFPLGTHTPNVILGAFDETVYDLSSPPSWLAMLMWAFSNRFISCRLGWMWMGVSVFAWTGFEVHSLIPLSVWPVLASIILKPSKLVTSSISQEMTSGLSLYASSLKVRVHDDPVEHFFGFRPCLLSVVLFCKDRGMVFSEAVLISTQALPWCPPLPRCKQRAGTLPWCVLVAGAPEDIDRMGHVLLRLTENRAWWLM